MAIAHCEYISPCSPVVLHRWGHARGAGPCRGARGAFRAPRIPAAPHHTARRACAVEPRAATAHCPACKPQRSLPSLRPPRARCPLPAGAAVLSDAPLADEPSVEGPQTLFGGLPRTLLLTGDAERLVREVRSLARAMGEDGVDLTVHWARDACHDPLILNAWWWGPYSARGMLVCRCTVG